MPTEKKTVRLLLLEDSQNEAERLISLFRNAGRATRAHRLTSSDDLGEALQQTWDLLIAAPHSENLEPAEALGAIRRQGKDLPFLQLVPGGDAEAITEAMLQGAQDGVPAGDDERLLLVAERELKNLEERRARRTAEVALREAEKRCQLLLDSSVDAITYVHDGMHIYVNRAYLELFGYQDADDIAGMPMIDLIQSADQARFKDFLKTYQQNTDEHAELLCGGVRDDGSQFRSRMSFSPASYDGEPCTQVVIRIENDNSELAEKLREISSQDLVTGLSNRSHFLEQLDHAVEQTVKGGKPATLALLRIDRYSNLLGDIGLADCDLLLADCASLLRQHFGETAQLARFADDSFAALLAGAPAQNEEALRSLLKLVEGHLFEIGGRSLQLTLSIGVAALDEQTSQPQLVLERALRCLDQLGDGNALKIHDPAEELAAAASRGNLIAMVQQALDGNGFALRFQPIISLHGDENEHYEVTLHLTNPQGEAVPGAQFLAAAEQAGLAAKVDRWMLLNAIRQLAEHRGKGHKTRLFLNLGAGSLQDPALLPWLSAALKAARLPADTLILQFGEPDVITYLKQARDLTKGLAELHCKVCLDRFGGALNPFNTLRHLQIDFVKLDGALLSDLSDTAQQDKLKTLIAGLHNEAKLTILPNIDNAGMLTTLWQTGANYVQGLYLQAPSPHMDYEFASSEE